MTALQNAQLQMCAAVKAVCDARTTEWTSFAPFGGPYTDFIAALLDVDQKIALQSTKSEGVKRIKDTQRQTLEAAVLQVGNALALYSSINNLPMAEDVYLSKSGIKRLTDKALTGQAVKISGIAAGITTPPLTTVKLTANDLTNLSNSMEAFTELIGQPRLKRAEAKRGTDQLAAAIRQLMDLLEQMDIAMNVLQNTNPDLFAEYTTAREIIDPGYSVRQLTVKVTSSTGEPLQGVTAVINPGDHRKESGAAGLFWINNLAAGSYTMVLTDKSHQSKTEQFNIAANQSTVLDVELLPNPNGA